MKTAQEIIEDEDQVFTAIDNRTELVETEWAINCMEQYAKEQCIAFLNLIIKYSNGVDNTVLLYTTAEELYKIFKDQQEENNDKDTTGSNG